jgi:NADPH-dependent glutamate synthase beta subunit-like oxidoreductase
MPWLQAQGVETDDWGRIVASVESRYRYQTTNPQIFAGGDAVRGADLVVTAMAEGRHARRGYSTGLELTRQNIIKPAGDKAGFTA